MTYALTDFKDGVTFTGAVTANSPVGPFTLIGGKYAVAVTAPGTSAALQVQMPDASFIAVGTSTNFTTSAAFVAVDLPAGTYQIVLTSAGAVAGFVAPIPYKPVA